MNSPIFFIVPLALVGFVLWSPWSPPKFYVHHDGEAVDGGLAAIAPDGGGMDSALRVSAR